MIPLPIFFLAHLAFVAIWYHWYNGLPEDMRMHARHAKWPYVLSVLLMLATLAQFSFAIHTAYGGLPSNNGDVHVRGSIGERNEIGRDTEREHMRLDRPEADMTGHTTVGRPHPTADRPGIGVAPVEPTGPSFD